MLLIPEIQIIIFIVTIVGISLGLESFNIGLINSGWFTSFITLLVGSFAIYLYLKQKEDYRRDAANILLMEIRYAEQMIEKYKTSGVPITISIALLLPTNNWNKYNHLFIKILDRDEIDAINNFYNQCTLIDKALLQLNLPLQLEQKAQSIHQTLSLIAKDSLSKADFLNKRKLYIKLIEKDNTLFKPNAPMESMVRALSTVQFIITTTAGDKLKKIAKIN